MLVATSPVQKDRSPFKNESDPTTAEHDANNRANPSSLNVTLRRRRYVYEDTPTTIGGTETTYCLEEGIIRRVSLLNDNLNQRKVKINFRRS